MIKNLYTSRSNIYKSLYEDFCPFYFFILFIFLSIQTLKKRTYFMNVVYEWEEDVESCTTRYPTRCLWTEQIHSIINVRTNSLKLLTLKRHRVTRPRCSIDISLTVWMTTKCMLMKMFCTWSIARRQVKAKYSQQRIGTGCRMGTEAALRWYYSTLIVHSFVGRGGVQTGLINNICFVTRKPIALLSTVNPCRVIIFV